MHNLHDQVILTEDLPQHQLKKGDVGTIVHIYQNGLACEVEFFAPDGQTLDVVTLNSRQVFMANQNTQIQAIIFDFGGVLVDWNPRYLYRKIFNEDMEAVENFLTEIGFNEWNVEQDRGRPFVEAVAELAAQFPHHTDAIRAYHLNYADSISGAITGTVEILKQVKAAGYPLYGLSNWSAETFPLVRPQYPFFEWFDVIVLSGEVKLIKPDPQIFHLLLAQIGYKAENCLFIDDSLPNIEAAKQLGFHTIHFESPEQLAAELGELNILP